MNFETGKRISGFNWTKLPIPQHVIERVNFLGKDQPKHLTWCDRHGEIIDDPPDAQITGVADEQNHPEEEKDELDLDIQAEQKEFADYEANDANHDAEPLALPTNVPF